MANSKQWQTINRLVVPFEKRYTKEFTRLLSRQIAPVMASIREFGVERTLNSIDNLIPIKPVAIEYQKLSVDTGSAFGKLTTRGIAGKKAEGDEFTDIWELAVAGMIGADVLAGASIASSPLGHRIVSVTETSRKRAIKLISNIVNEGMTEGLGRPEIARNINKQVPKAWRIESKFRSIRIAQTEVIAASNKSSFTAAQGSGLPMNKIWLAGGANIRDAHISADGEEVALNDMFIMTGEPMEEPGDIRGSSENVINCKCAMAYKQAI